MYKLDQLWSSEKNFEISSWKNLRNFPTPHDYTSLMTRQILEA